VTLIRDPTQDNRDRYDRLLRYVERGSIDVGRKQIRKGWAEVYVFERPFQRLRGYQDAEDGASARNRGVWRRCGGDFHQPL
jgi:endonuclease YncB( thermonuclease family)